MKSLILGSNSPRRKEILSNLGFEFIVRASDMEEIVPIDMSAIKVAEHLAELKNHSIERLSQNEIVLTADTVVIYQEEILGKPTDDLDAFNMLTRLSGHIHQVVTGVCISSETNKISFSNCTEVKFMKLTSSEIRYYIDHFQPFDKAGAYGIQEWIGQMGIEWIRGSYYNVTGLPSDEVYKLLVKDFDIHPG